MHARASVTPGSSSKDYVFLHIFLVETFLAMTFGLSQKLGRLLSEPTPCNLFFYFVSNFLFCLFEPRQPLATWPWPTSLWVGFDCWRQKLFCLHSGFGIDCSESREALLASSRTRYPTLLLLLLPLPCLDFQKVVLWPPELVPSWSQNFCHYILKRSFLSGHASYETFVW